MSEFHMIAFVAHNNSTDSWIEVRNGYRKKVGDLIIPNEHAHAVVAHINAYPHGPEQPASGEATASSAATVNLADPPTGVHELFKEQGLL